MNNLPASMEACPVPDDGKRVVRVPELTTKHATKPWAEPGEKPRSGLACVKCHKTWEWVELSPDHVRLMPNHDILIER